MGFRSLFKITVSAGSLLKVIKVIALIIAERSEKVGESTES